MKVKVSGKGKGGGGRRVRGRQEGKEGSLKSKGEREGGIKEGKGGMESREVGTTWREEKRSGGWTQETKKVEEVGVDWGGSSAEESS